MEISLRGFIVFSSSVIFNVCNDCSAVLYVFFNH
uniref:Uncharacterized protein n=1 Tax=Anguilla anguilla TaxID=7936 RepID=A0A0E9TZQ0_ANGAN